MHGSRRAILNAFKDKKIVLIGDVILDEYVYAHEVCKALDVPVPEAEETRASFSFGGAGLVAANILALGGRIDFFSVIGTDDAARHYEGLKHPKLRKFFIRDRTRKTTVKSRWFVDGKKLLQVNKVDNHYLDSKLEKKLLSLLAPAIRTADTVVISDPQHGLLSRGAIRDILMLSKKHGKPVYVDSQISHRGSNYHLYRGADCVFLNEKEAKAVSPSFNVARLLHSLETIRKKLKVSNVIVKLGPQGSVALWNGRYIKSPGMKVKSVDPCGAGDAFLAAFCLADRNDPQESLAVANIWAALSTRVHGTIPPKRKDLVVALGR